MLLQQPLALYTLAWLELRCCGSLALMLEVARLLGALAMTHAPYRDPVLKGTSFFSLQEVTISGILAIVPVIAAGLQEAGQASAADVVMLRLLTPLAKLFTAEEAVVVCSEG